MTVLQHYDQKTNGCVYCFLPTQGKVPLTHLLLMTYERKQALKNESTSSRLVGRQARNGTVRQKCKQCGRKAGGLPVCLVACLSVWWPACLSGGLPVCLVTACLSDGLPVCLVACLPVCMVACLSVWWPACLSDGLPVCLVVCLSVWWTGCGRHTHVMPIRFSTEDHAQDTLFWWGKNYYIF